VLSLSQRSDGSWDVVTDKGTVHAEHVVNCAGLWAREIGRMVGIDLPVLAMEHHYLITEDIPELVGRPREFVNTTDYAGEIYVRQERGGAPDGDLRTTGRDLVAPETPDDFSMQLLPTMCRGSRPTLSSDSSIFPRSAAWASARPSTPPFTFAPDGNPLVGRSAA